MIGRDDLTALARRAVESSAAAATEVVISAEDLAVTRWNQNHIHQNLARHNASLSVRVLDDQRIGLASTNQLTLPAVQEAVRRALAHARLQRPNPAATGFAVPRRPHEDAPAALDRATAQCSPADRAGGAGAVIEAAQRRALDSAGTFATSVQELAVANSLGVQAYHAGTKAFIRTIVSQDDITGYADQLSSTVGDLSYDALAAEAIAKATLHREASELPAGQYDTLFEPVALADLVRFLGYLAFGARAVQEGRSFMGPDRGRKVMSRHVTIWDDGLDARGIMSPFDAEGVPREKVVFIDQGIAGDVVYDTQTAAKDGRASTGHASPYGRWNSGPMPRNMLMKPGESSRAAIIGSTKRGVLVTRFHYTHAPEPMRVVATGTTRDGTFLIEDGQLVARLRNLRFTESMIDAFARIDAVSREARLARDWWSTFESYLPAVRIAGFTFTGTTTF